MVDKKIGSLSLSIALFLSDRKAYDLPKTCLDYGLQEAIGAEDANEAYRSKRIYILNRLSDKSTDFILSLAKKLVKDFESDYLGNSLDIYYDGNYFKISKITRQNIAKIIDEVIGVDANIPIDCLDKNFIQFIEDFLHPISKTGKITEEVINGINYHLQKDGFKIITEVDRYDRIIYRFISEKGVSGKVKNIIFAANGPKPEIVLSDALNNNIQITKNSQFCLVYDHAIPITGLKWIDLVKWWSDKNGIERNANCAKNLLFRLREAISSPPELCFFDAYYRDYKRLELLRRN